MHGTTRLAMIVVVVVVVVACVGKVWMLKVFLLQPHQGSVVV